MSARETEQARMEGGERVDGGGECWGAAAGSGSSHCHQRGTGCYVTPWES